MQSQLHSNSESGAGADSESNKDHNDDALLRARMTSSSSSSSSSCSQSASTTSTMTKMYQRSLFYSQEHNHKNQQRQQQQKQQQQHYSCHQIQIPYKRKRRLNTHNSDIITTTSTIPKKSTMKNVKIRTRGSNYYYIRTRTRTRTRTHSKNMSLSMSMSKTRMMLCFILLSFFILDKFTLIPTTLAKSDDDNDIGSISGTGSDSGNSNDNSNEKINEMINEKMNEKMNNHVNVTDIKKITENSNDGNGNGNGNSIKKDHAAASVKPPIKPSSLPSSLPSSKVHKSQPNTIPTSTINASPSSPSSPSSLPQSSPSSPSGKSKNKKESKTKSKNNDDEQHQQQYQHQQHQQQQQQHKQYKYKKQYEKRQKRHKAFLKWCQTTLGIQTLLEIKDFEYINHFNEWKYSLKQQNDFHYYNDEDQYGDDYGHDYARDYASVHDYEEFGDNYEQDNDEPSKITVRGLVATRDIEIDEVVISVPYHALITIHTTIDHDPVLSQILGPKARRRHKWILSNESDNSSGNGSGNGSGNDDYNGNDNDNDNSTGGNSSTGSINDGRNNYRSNYSNSQNNNDTPNSSFIKGTSYYEIGLLTVALLYHRSLGELSPINFQIDTLLDDTLSGVDNMPLLWDNNRLRNEFDGLKYGPSGDEVRRLVLTMKKDVKVMYDEIMGVLIRDHGDIFGRPRLGEYNDDNDDNDNDNDGGRGGGGDSNGNGKGSNNINGDEKNEWMFSYRKFEWAFSMVNSRKWHLPLADLDETIDDIYHGSNNNNGRHEIPDPAAGHDAASGAANSMPAQQPTDEYMSLQDEAIRLEYEDEDEKLEYEYNTMPVIKHSFMAPLADMLNFGPPCAKGRYNTESKRFEVIATCSFLQGQEVTFWYSDDCEHVMIANYGFTHPMIPPCFSADDWQNRSEIWKKYAQSLEKTLDQVYEELYDTLQELKDCNCNDDRVDVDVNAGSDTYGDAYVDTRNNDMVENKDERTVNVRNDEYDQNMEEDGQGGIRRIRQRDHDDLGL